MLKGESAAHKIRPYSAEGYRKSYRIPLQSEYNSVRSSVMKTFNRKKYGNKQCTAVLELIKPCSKHVNKKINNLLVKYSVNVDYSKRKLSCSDGDVDVQFVVENYIKSRSANRQQEDNLSKIKNYVNNIYCPTARELNRTEQFFPIDTQNLKRLENNQRKNEEDKNIFTIKQKRKQHPYMAIYNTAQSKAVQLINNKKPVVFKGEQINIQQVQQWQKYERDKMSIYKEIKAIKQLSKQRSGRKSRYNSYQSIK